MNRYQKPILMVVAAVVIAVQAAITDGITASEWMLILAALFGAVGTYVTPELTQWPQSKAVVNGLVVVLGVLATLIVGGLDQAEIFQLVVLVLGLLGVPTLTGPKHVSQNVVMGGPTGNTSGV